MINKLQLQPASRRFVFPVLAVLLILVVAVGIAAVMSGLWATSTALASFAIEMTSAPYPLRVGNTALLVSLLDADGRPVSGAEVSASARMRREGTLPLATQAESEADGVYHLPITWPMSGRWDVEVRALMPGNASAATEQFAVYVYAVPPPNFNARTTFVSVGELAARPYDPAREYRIIIPQGTYADVISGHGEELIPEEIRLSLSGQHVLVIQNDDIAHHVVGPFYVRAGETIRQEFRRPATFQGSCSIRHYAVVSIIVDE